LFGLLLVVVLLASGGKPIAITEIVVERPKSNEGE
jgi:hypothetical protein